MTEPKNPVGKIDDADKTRNARAQTTDAKIPVTGGGQVGSGGGQMASGGGQTTSGGGQTASGGGQTASGGGQLATGGGGQIDPKVVDNLSRGVNFTVDDPLANGFRYTERTQEFKLNVTNNSDVAIGYVSEIETNANGDAAVFQTGTPRVGYVPAKKVRKIGLKPQWKPGCSFSVWFYAFGLEKAEESDAAALAKYNQLKEDVKRTKPVKVEISYGE